MNNVNSNNIKVMIMAGGTGGHVFPALAVAQELIKRGCDVQWFGTRNGIEARIVPANNIPLNFLEISGLRGKGFKALLLAPWKILNAIYAAKRILKQFKPNVVLGMGGYASGPGGIAAWLLGTPLVIHEQNARPGSTNKWLARFAAEVLSGFPEVLPKTQCIGNPVREEIASLPEPLQRGVGTHEPLQLLVLGGSLGAQAINEVVPAALQLLDGQINLHVRHQCGAKHYEQTLANYRMHQVNGDVVAFIDDMASALAWADLVICRAGALTVSELSAAGIASILVPFPHAIDDHQTANAQWLVDQGAAEIRQQSVLNAKELSSLIMSFSNNKNKVLEMAQAARSVAKPFATQKCADICMEVAHG